MNRIIMALLVLSILMVVAGGCGEYKDKIANQGDEISSLRIDKAELEATKDDLESTRAKLESVQAELEATNDELETRVASLIEYQKALEDQLKELGVNRSKMAEQYKEAKANLKAQQKLIDEMKKRQNLAQKRLKTLKKMLEKFKSLIEGGKLNVRIRNGKLMLELPSAVLFESGIADLSKDGKQTLAEVAAVLADIKGREFQVAGHTDNMRIRTANFPSNWELSTSRAVSVVKFLQEKGVKPTQLSAAGYSKYQPYATNKEAKGRAFNRRIEITLMPNLDELPDLSALEKEIKQ